MIHTLPKELFTEIIGNSTIEDMIHLSGCSKLLHDRLRGSLLYFFFGVSGVIHDVLSVIESSLNNVNSSIYIIVYTKRNCTCKIYTSYHKRFKILTEKHLRIDSDNEYEKKSVVYKKKIFVDSTKDLVDTLKYNMVHDSSAMDILLFPSNKKVQLLTHYVT